MLCSFPAAGKLRECNHNVNMITLTNQYNELVLHQTTFCENLIIKISSATEVVIENQIGSNQSYLIELRDNRFTLFEVGSFQSSNHKLCIQQSIKQICDPTFSHVHSIVEGVDVLMAGKGVKVQIIDSKIKYDIYYSPIRAISAPEYHDPIEILVDNIKRILSNKNTKCVAVRFSGGVDSTALLLIAIELLGKDNVLAVTWTNNSGSAHMDKTYAASFCKNLGVKNIQLDFSEEFFFGEPKSSILPIIKTGYILDRFYFYESEMIKTHFPECNLIMDGHGGDHVFLDPVPVEILKTIFKENGIKGLSKAARSFRLLYGSSISRHIYTRMRGAAFYKKNTLNYFSGKALSIAKINLKRKEFINSHLTYLREAIFHNSTNPSHPELIDVSHPFTTKDMIAYGVSLDVSTLFDESTTRIPFRKAIHARYGEHRLRKDKGHITGAYQRALAKHSTGIDKIISNGSLVKNEYLNLDKFNLSMRLHASGINGCDPAILKIILFELMCIYFRGINE